MGNKINAQVTGGTIDITIKPLRVHQLQDGAINGLYGLSKDMKPSIVPGLLGGVGSAFTTEATNALMQNKIKEVKEKNSESKN
ncbi:hypothetical protein [Proteus faecis]|uniref:hypothetical protein n=1 Tax=Proteus faecis TaxID=2050967 RepID=UPI000D69FFBC|nr:hypothetical protein [Proteus faecis]